MNSNYEQHCLRNYIQQCVKDVIKKSQHKSHGAFWKELDILLQYVFEKYVDAGIIRNFTFSTSIKFTNDRTGRIKQCIVNDALPGDLVQDGQGRLYGIVIAVDNDNHDTCKVLCSSKNYKEVHVRSHVTLLGSITNINIDVKVPM